jgi:hypothetical protein
VLLPKKDSDQGVPIRNLARVVACSAQRNKKQYEPFGTTTPIAAFPKNQDLSGGLTATGISGTMRSAGLLTISPVQEKRSGSICRGNGQWERELRRLRM